MRSFITTDSYTDNSLFKILIAWRFQFLIIFVLFCLVILFFWWKQYIKNLSVNQNLKKGLPFETLTDDTVRKIPLQTSASNRRMLVSKPFKTNNKKSLKSNKSCRTAKNGPSVDPPPTIIISLVVSKENNDHKDEKPIDQNLSNSSLLTLNGIKGLKSKHISRSISVEFPSINLIHDISNKTNNESKQQIVDDFETKILADPSETLRF